MLPNNSNILMAARQAGEASPKTVCVIKSVTVPQGVSAALAFNPVASFEENCEAMQVAAAEPVVLEVTRAVRDAAIDGVKTRAGQYIGLLDDRLTTAADTATEVVGRLAAEAAAVDVEIITIYLGAELTEAGAADVIDALRRAFADAEVEVVSGGQAHYDYIISLE